MKKYSVKNILLLSLILVSGHSWSKVYNLKPTWKVGDKKHVQISFDEKEYLNDSLISDTLYFNEADIKVISETKSHYKLSVKFENQIWKTAALFYDKLGEDLPEYRNLDLRYKIDKKTGEATLLNWKEAKSFIDNGFKQMEKLIQKKDTTGVGVDILDLAFGPVKSMLKDKEGVEGYMMSNVDYFISVYNHDFELGKRITTVDSTENPFNPRETISQKTSYTLKSINKKKHFLIEEEVELDLTQFMSMMKEMMKSMGKSFGASDSSLTEKEKELEDFSMDMENKTNVYYNKKSGWVEKVIRTGAVVANDPVKKSRTKKGVVVTFLITDK